MGGEHDVEDADAEERLPALEAEEDAGDLARGQVDRRHDHAVEQQAEIDGAEPAHDAGRVPRVADLVELEVREDAGSPPQLGVEEHRRHTGEDKRPPDPVAGDAVAPDDVGDEVGGVAAEGGRHHREPGEPPGHRAPGGEELGGVAARPPREEQRRDEAHEQRDGHDHPIERGEDHGATLYPKWGSGGDRGSGIGIRDRVMRTGYGIPDP